MKKTLIALAVALVTVQVQAQSITRFQTAPGQFSYWQDGQYLGYSQRDLGAGTETWYPAYGHQGYGYGYQSGCCYNRPFAEGAQMGRDITTIIRSLTGR